MCSVFSYFIFTSCMYLSMCTPIRDLPDCVTHVTFQIIQYKHLLRHLFSFYFGVHCTQVLQESRARIQESRARHLSRVKSSVWVYSRRSLSRFDPPKTGSRLVPFSAPSIGVSGFSVCVCSGAYEYLQTVYSVDCRSRDTGLVLS